LEVGCRLVIWHILWQSIDQVCVRLGFGTRLRPLTLTLPKPLVEFANKPMILHQIEALVQAGVKHIVLAVNYRPEIMVSVLERYEKEFGVKITFSVESEPLGTAGPLALAREILAKDNSPFFVLNSDIICDFPFVQLRDFHLAHGREGTIVVSSRQLECDKCETNYSMKLMVVCVGHQGGGTI
jgi:mannose-1-phosphate guanylyltransferase